MGEEEVVCSCLFQMLVLQILLYLIVQPRKETCKCFIYTGHHVYNEVVCRLVSTLLVEWNSFLEVDCGVPFSPFRIDSQKTITFY